MITGRPVLTLTFLLTAAPIGAHLTLGLTAPPSVPRGAETRPCDWVTQSPILTLTSVTAVWTPMVTVTSTGAVGAAPARLTLAGVGGHASAVDTALTAEGCTDLSLLVEAGAALGLPPVHSLLPSAIGRPVAHPVSGALEPVEDVGAAGVVNLVVRMSVGLLHCHRVTFPVAADVGILQVQRRSDTRQEAEGSSQ